MKKLFIVGGAVAVAFVARRRASSGGGIDFEQLIERMPENAPPKWMFHNIKAIRENTDRILQLLEGQRTPARGSAAPPP